MCLKHAGFRKMLVSSNFTDVGAIIIDEAHCMAQWGGDFRPAYSELGKLRAFFPPSIPVLATSATLTPAALHEVHSQLGINVNTSFHLNLGNDRPNIAYSAIPIDSSSDYDALRAHLCRTPNPTCREDIKKSALFGNTVMGVQVTTRKIREWLPNHLKSCVGYVYSIRTSGARRRVMERFRKGEILILVCTESAGMVRFHLRLCL